MQITQQIDPMATTQVWTGTYAMASATSLIALSIVMGICLYRLRTRRRRHLRRSEMRALVITVVAATSGLLGQIFRNALVYQGLDVLDRAPSALAWPIAATGATVLWALAGMSWLWALAESMNRRSASSHW